MPRGKVKLAFIVNQEARKTSFRKRKEGLLKKLEELTILCGSQACAIIYSPYQPQPELWPNDNSAFQDVLNQFISMSHIDQTKKMVNHESYIKQRISKVEKQINKQMKLNHDMEMANKMSDCLTGKVSVAELRLTDLNGIISLTDDKLKDIEYRVAQINSEAPAAAAPPSQSQLPQLQPQPQEVVGGSKTTAAEGMDAEFYIPVMETPEDPYRIQTPGWYPDWVGDLLDPDLGNVPGVDMTMTVTDDPNPSLSTASHQKTN